MVEFRKGFSLKRRQLMKSAAAIGLLAKAAAERSVWAAGDATDPVRGLALFAPEKARILLAVCRTLFPHDFLGDAYYFECVRRIDGRAHRDAAVAAQLAAGLARLPEDFTGMPQHSREAVIQTLVGTPFFKLMRQTTANGLYRTPQVWPHFGYPGPSLEFGGYIDRTLVDIDWLPEGPP
jgi:hypothetical protein